MAETSFCNPTNDYNYQWKIEWLSEEEEKFLNIRGKSLKIPPNVLKEAKVYEINVTLIGVKENNSLASVSEILRIL